MAYGHAERNLACIRQLEADLRKQMEMRNGTALVEAVDVTGNRETGQQGEPLEG